MVSLMKECNKNLLPVNFMYILFFNFFFRSYCRSGGYRPLFWRRRVPPPRVGIGARA